VKKVLIALLSVISLCVFAQTARFNDEIYFIKGAQQGYVWRCVDSNTGLGKWTIDSSVIVTFDQCLQNQGNTPMGSDYYVDFGGRALELYNGNSFWFNSPTFGWWSNQGQYNFLQINDNEFQLLSDNTNAGLIVHNEVGNNFTRFNYSDIHLLQERKIVFNDYDTNWCVQLTHSPNGHIVTDYALCFQSGLSDGQGEIHRDNTGHVTYEVDNGSNTTEFHTNFAVNAPVGSDRLAYLQLGNNTSGILPNLEGIQMGFTDQDGNRVTMIQANVASYGADSFTLYMGSQTPVGNGTNMIMTRFNGGSIYYSDTSGSDGGISFSPNSVQISQNNLSGSSWLAVGDVVNYSVGGTTIYLPTTVGTAGQVLTSNGSGVPYWQTPTSSNDLVGYTPISKDNVGFGQFQPDSTIGYQNCWFGQEAGYSMIGSTASIYGISRNSFFGKNTGANLDSSANNTLIGSDAGVSAHSGNRNTIVGAFADFNTGTIDGVAIGMQAKCTGTANTAIGVSAMMATDSIAENNIGIGVAVFENMTEGLRNVAVGNSAGTGIVSATNTTTIGFESEMGDSYGHSGVAVGDFAYTRTNSIALGSHAYADSTNQFALSDSIHKGIKAKGIPTAPYSVLTDFNGNGIWNMQPSGLLYDTVFTASEIHSDTVYVAKNAVNIIEPGGATAIIIYLPNSPSRGDFFELKAGSVLSPITYLNGSTGDAAPAALGFGGYTKLVYCKDNKWH
jgi:hypothetical protein